MVVKGSRTTNLENLKDIVYFRIIMLLDIHKVLNIYFAANPNIRQIRKKIRAMVYDVIMINGKSEMKTRLPSGHPFENEFKES